MRTKPGKHVLFVHPAFPAQFGHIARRLSTSGYRCTFVSEEGEDAPEASLDGSDLPPVERIRYGRVPRRTAGYLTQDVDEEVAHAEAVHRALSPMRDTLRPDLIVGHAGWGSTLFLPELFPDTPILTFVEYFHAPGRSASEFRPDWPARPETALRQRVQNAGTLLNLESCDAAYTPTRFQHSLIPSAYRSKTRVIHDGIDTSFWRRLRERGSGEAGSRIVTYVSRGLEAFRGFDVFMQVAKRICDMLPDVVFVVVGSEQPTYGHDGELIDAPSLKQHLLDTGEYDLDRFSFTGWIPPQRLLQVLNLSDLHIYLTVPFVLSWSLLDAMACGCVVLASDTEPVREVISDGTNGLLRGFFDVEGMTDAAVRVLERTDDHLDLGRAAEETIRGRYSLDVVLPRLESFFEEVIAAGRG